MCVKAKEWFFYVDHRHILEVSLLCESFVCYLNIAHKNYLHSAQTANFDE